MPHSAVVANLFGPVNRVPGVVNGGRVETALGFFDADGMADGATANVFIRPEGVILTPVQDTPANGARTATVRAARLLGRSSHLRLTCDNQSGIAELLARVSGVFLPETGAQLTVELDGAQVFVFPAE